MPETAKRVGDGIALAGGSFGTLAQWSEVSGQIAPILSAVFLLLSVAWILWRMLDRVRFGPSGRRDE